MADVNDANGWRRQLDREWDHFDEAGIDDRDREAIYNFVEYRRDTEQRKPTALISDLGNLRPLRSGPRHHRSTWTPQP